jgi:hypothetical protein
MQITEPGTQVAVKMYDWTGTVLERSPFLEPDYYPIKRQDGAIRLVHVSMLTTVEAQP